MSISYGNDRGADCPVPAAAVIEPVPRFDAVGVWHATRTATIPQMTYFLRRLPIHLGCLSVSQLGCRSLLSFTPGRITTQDVDCPGCRACFADPPRRLFPSRKWGLDVEHS